MEFGKINYNRATGYVNSVYIEKAKVIYRHFSGVENKFNREGERNFTIVIDDIDFAENLMEAGFNVKPIKPLEGHENDPVQFQLEIKLGYKIEKLIPLVETFIDNKRATTYSEETVIGLDSADIKYCDVTFSPRYYDSFNGNKCTAWAKKAGFHIVPDEYDLRHACMYPNSEVPANGEFVDEKVDEEVPFN